MVVFYDQDLTEQLEKDFENDLLDCAKMTEKKYGKIEPIRRFRNSVARLMSPLL